MRIVGIENLDGSQIAGHVQAGARFVLFQYCISVVVMTFKRSSDVYFIQPGESTFQKSLPFTLCSLFLGWWGIPWGPIWTVSTIVTSLALVFALNSSMRTRTALEGSACRMSSDNARFSCLVTRVIARAVGPPP